MNFILFQHSTDNMTNAIAKYGKHKRYIVAEVVMYSSKGYSYIVFADYRQRPTEAMLKKLAANEWYEYYHGMGNGACERHSDDGYNSHCYDCREVRDLKINEMVDDYIIVDTANIN